MLTLVSSFLPSGAKVPPDAIRPPANSTSNRVSPYLEKSSSVVSRTLTALWRFFSRLSSSRLSSKMVTTASAKEPGSRATAIFRFLVLIVTPLHDKVADQDRSCRPPAAKRTDQRALNVDVR